MPLDPTKYKIADQPWTYEVVAANLRQWGYEPVGDHSPEHLLNPDGFLEWEKRDPKTGRAKVFAISNPKWRTYGMNTPVWPAKVIGEAMVIQEVHHRVGAHDQGKGLDIRLTLIESADDVPANKPKAAKPDDPEQSERFIESARKAEAAETEEGAQRAFRRAVGNPKPGKA